MVMSFIVIVICYVGAVVMLFRGRVMYYMQALCGHVIQCENHMLCASSV